MNTAVSETNFLSDSRTKKRSPIDFSWVVKSLTTKIDFCVKILEKKKRNNQKKTIFASFWCISWTNVWKIPTVAWWCRTNHDFLVHKHFLCALLNCHTKFCSYDACEYLLKDGLGSLLCSILSLWIHTSVNHLIFNFE